MRISTLAVVALCSLFEGSANIANAGALLAFCISKAYVRFPPISITNADVEFLGSAEEKDRHPDLLRRYVKLAREIGVYDPKSTYVLAISQIVRRPWGNTVILYVCKADAAIDGRFCRNWIFDVVANSIDDDMLKTAMRLVLDGDERLHRECFDGA